MIRIKTGTTIYVQITENGTLIVWKTVCSVDEKKFSLEKEKKETHPTSKYFILKITLFLVFKK